MAEKGKISTGRFFVFKLHMIIDDAIQIIDIKITKGNVDDKTPIAELIKQLKSSIYADGYYANLFKT